MVSQSSQVGVAGFALTLALGLCLSVQGKDIPFDLTGVVVDRDTGNPLVGAYVIAAYHEAVTGPAALTQWCVKTRGAVTNAEGRFSFPVEKLDGMSPASLAAFKSGYYLHTVTSPDRATFKKQDSNAYANRKVMLVKQDPARPEFVFGTTDAFCNHARTAADAAAGVRFLEMEVEERVRLGGKPNNIAALRQMIERLRAIGNPQK